MIIEHTTSGFLKGHDQRIAMGSARGRFFQRQSDGFVEEWLIRCATHS
jgi:hypothetical protein